MGSTHSTSHWRAWRSRLGEGTVTVRWRSWALVPLALLLLVVELAFPSRLWNGLLVLTVGLLVVAAWWAWQLARNVRVKRELGYAWLQVGGYMEERFTLFNDALVPALWVEIDDHSDLPGYTASAVRSAEARNVVRWSTRGYCGLRGEYQLGPWEVRMGDPFGLFLVTLAYPATEDVLVYPPVTRWSIPELPWGASLGQAGARARARQPTAMIRSVREYAPGDPFTHIHWLSTARRGALHVREFDQETGEDVWLVLDLDRVAHQGEGELSTLEAGVVLSASLVARLLEANRRVGLLAYGQERFLARPAGSREHLWRLLRALALARPGGAFPLSQVLTEVGRVLPAGSTLLIVTPSFDASWVAALGRLKRRGVMAHVYQLALGQPEAASLQPLLAPLGVTAQVIDAREALAAGSQASRTEPWSFKVLPTGRAVAVSRPVKRGGRWLPG